MSRCKLEQTVDGWWCRVCDPEKERLLLRGDFKRSCRRSVGNAHSVTTFNKPPHGRSRRQPRDPVVSALCRYEAADSPPIPRADFLDRLDACIDCKHLDDIGCTQLAGSQCKQARRWFDLLVSSEGCLAGDQCPEARQDTR